ncbi:MAG TPA: hypothetical protein VFA18_17785, partial [Gemmataceae bacterium]|nr:hypothetical protein [Gemmataceae bacterium]
MMESEPAMPAETVCCPYCNSCVTTEAHAAPVVCPRCGETLPEQTVTGTDHTGNGIAAPGSGLAGTSSNLASRRRANRQTGLLILGAMFILAAVGFAYMLVTHDFRRRNDPVSGSATALGYLPSDTDVAAMIHVQKLRTEPAGKDLLGFFGLTTRDDGRDRAEQLLGVKLNNIEAVVLSIKTEAVGLRPIVLVQTERPYDAEKVRAILDTGPPIHDGYRTVYQVRSAQLGLRGVWFAAANVLVLGGRVEDLEAVPQSPGSGPLPEALGQFVVDSDMAPVWLTGHLAQWPLELAPWLDALGQPAATVVSNIRTFALWLDLKKDMTVRAKLDCADAKSAKSLAKMLQEIRLPDLKLMTSQSDIQVTAELNADMHAL